MASSTKPEVHKVLQRSKKEDQAKTTGNMHRIFGQELKTRGVVPEICMPTDKHTDKQTNMLTTILHSPLPGAQ